MDKNQPPFFSVVIPTLNEEVNIAHLLKLIQEQSYGNFEVIVSDCLSTDHTPTVVDSFKEKIPNLTLFSHKSKDVSQARNLGASQTRGDFLIFFDADVKIEKDFFLKIKEEIDHYHLDCLTIWNRAEKNSRFSGKLMLGLLNLSMTIFQKIKPVANGPCIIIKKTLFEKIHGFDEDIVFGEDFDLIQKASRLKTMFAVFPTPILYVSTRRFDKEGFFVSLGKSLKALVHQLFIGPIKKPIFEYNMGGQEFNDKHEG